MTKSKKKFLVITLAVLLLIPVIYYMSDYLYVEYIKSELTISFGKTTIANEDDRKLNILAIAWDGSDRVDSTDVDNKIGEITIWSSKVVSDLTRNHTAPMNIDISGDVVDGKTVLRYSGTATTKDGKKVDYLEEKVFDFVLVPDEELPKSDI